MPLRVVALEYEPTIVHLYQDLLTEHGYEVTALSQSIDEPEAFSDL